MVLILERLPYVAEMGMYARGDEERTPCRFETCTEPECPDVRDIVAWIARNNRQATRRQEKRDYVHIQMVDLLKSGVSSLPPRDQMFDIDLRVNVQQAVDSLPRTLHLPITFPTLVWRYLQGYTTRELGHAVGVPHSQISVWLREAWAQCRTLLEDYREDRRHWGESNGTPV